MAEGHRAPNAPDIKNRYREIKNSKLSFLVPQRLVRSMEKVH
jgi:hypothetical protein